MLSWEVSWDFGPCSKISYLLCLAWPCFINHSLRALPLYQSRWKYLQHLRASEMRSNDEHKSTEFILFLFCILLMSILLLKDQSSDTRLYLINFKSWNITSCSVPLKSDAQRHLPSKQIKIFPVFAGVTSEWVLWELWYGSVEHCIIWPFVFHKVPLQNLTPANIPTCYKCIFLTTDTNC